MGPDGERVERAPAGTVVVVPPDVPHAFRNDDAPDAVFLNVHAPDKGFAQYMRNLRDGVHASFDSYDLPVDGARPGSEAIIVAGTYEGDDLRIVPGDGGVEISAPGAPAIRFVHDDAA